MGSLSLCRLHHLNLGRSLVRDRTRLPHQVSHITVAVITILGYHRNSTIGVGDEGLGNHLVDRETLGCSTDADNDLVTTIVQRRMEIPKESDPLLLLRT